MGDALFLDLGLGFGLILGLGPGLELRCLEGWDVVDADSRLEAGFLGNLDGWV